MVYKIFIINISAIKAYIYVANETPANIYFDDFSIKHTKAIKVIQENHFYPFGMSMKGLELRGNPDHRFKFNGKERTEVFGVNMDDFGWRHYDPARGRWDVPDPLSQKYYSISNYVFVANNPINAIDPDGAKIVFLNSTKATNLEQRIQYLQDNNKAFNTLFTTIRDDPSYTYYVRIDNEELRKYSANGAVLPITDQVLFKDNVGDGTYLSDKAIVEEFFHVLQHETYKGERSSPEREAEAKLFDYVVLGQLKHNQSLTEYEFSFITDDNLHGLHDKPSSSIIGEELEKSYFEYLEYFEQTTHGHSFYGGEQRKLLPELYNNLFDND